MRYYIIGLSVITLLLVLFWNSIYTENSKILEVVELPNDERFYNQTAASHYDLSYVFHQKRLFGLVFSAAHKSGGYALAYDNKNLTPYLLSDTELIQLLAMYNLPTPTRIPSYPIYENPLLFYLMALVLLFLLGRLALFPLTKNFKRLKGQMTIKKISNPYAGYLRRRY